MDPGVLNELKQRYADALSATLLENLLAESPSLSDDQVTDVLQAWRDPAIEQVETRMSRWSDQSRTLVTPQVVVEEAQQRALSSFQQERNQPNKETTNSKVSATATGSFSLFDHLNAMGGMTFFSWENVQEQTESTEERLKLLVKLEYLDDIFPDWETGVRPFLQKIPMNESVLSLYETWYGKARDSSGLEFQSFQADVAQDVLAMVKRHDETESLFLRSGVCLAMDMLCDMVADGQQQHRTVVIGSQLFAFLSDDRRSHIMCHVDPYGSCFRSWIPSLSCNEAIALLSEQKNGTCLLSHLLRVCSMTTGAAMGLYSLSILRSVLFSTRLSCFPWHLMSETDEDNHTNSVLSLFLQGLSYQLDHPNPADCAAIFSMFAEALETIANGLSVYPNEQKMSILQDCQASVAALHRKLSLTSATTCEKEASVLVSLLDKFHPV